MACISPFVLDKAKVPGGPVHPSGITYQPSETLVAAAASNKEPDSSTHLTKRSLYNEHGHGHEVLLCGDKDDNQSFDDEVTQRFPNDWAPVFPFTGGNRNPEMIYLPAGQIKKRKEVNFNRLNAARQAQFEQAMRMEWANIQKPHATRILDLKETSKIRSRPNMSKRIIQTRWVLTEKEHETGEATTAKACLAIQSHNDPDVGEVERASPTLSREALPMLLLRIAGCKWTLHAADIKRAFTVGFRKSCFVGPKPWHIEIGHRVKTTSTINLFGFETLKLKNSKIEIMETDRMNSRALNRPNGPLYAQLPHIWPAEGVDPQQLTEVKAAWYGLNDCYR